MLLQRIFHKVSPIYSYTVSGKSMAPTLKPGDTVLVNRLAYLFKSPEIGDTVAVRDPRDGKVLIKRISKINDRKYFVVGDNKNASTDSRTFGWIRKKDIMGKVIFSKTSN